MSLIGGWSALVDPLYESSPATLPHTQLLDRKSTRLNSSHSQISYAVFCLKKKTHFLRRRGHQHGIQLADVEGHVEQEREDQISDQRARHREKEVTDRRVFRVLMRSERSTS